MAIALIVATFAAGTVTFLGMTSNLPVTVSPWSLLLLLNLDLVLLLCLSAMIVRRAVILWVAHRRGAAGAHLHIRLAALFGLVAVTPTIIVATFSVVLFDFGLQGWFSDRVRTAVEESFAVARAYLEEHRQTISADALSVAQVLNQRGVSLALNPKFMSRLLAGQMNLHSLNEAVVFNRSGRILATAGYSVLMEFDPQIPDWALRRAEEGQVAILTAETDDQVRALVRLDSFDNTFLYVGRMIDPRVLAHIDRTQNAVRLYKELEGKRSDLQLTFALIFVVVALMLLLAATWVGLAFANRLSRPIGRLISAAERVGAGDLRARVDDAEDPGEIGLLTKAFNQMTAELDSRRQDLLVANRQLDYRSRFIEAVLGGVSAGVIGLDKDGVITLPNRSACQLLSMEPARLRDKPLRDVVPRMAGLVTEARRRPEKLAEGTIEIERSDGNTRKLLVRVAAEVQEASVIGFVVTFDDVTELLSAQRKAAWADVARRIAHEIKNPLTPIQLSAERLRRKYRDEVRSDPETFDACTDIIVRRVNDIGRMVDEFSSFARMPTPVFQDENLDDLVRETMFLQRGAHPEIAFTTEAPEAPVIVSCDREQMGRAITNLLQNAVDAIGRRTDAGGAAEDGEESHRGHITVRLIREETTCVIEVEDDGCGLPREKRHRLTEPYVTTRAEGTGLGLAIVTKIMEDHGGEVRLKDRPEGGARVRLILPAHNRPAASAAPNEKRKTGSHGA